MGVDGSVHVFRLDLGALEGGLILEGGGDAKLESLLILLMGVRRKCNPSSSSSSNLNGVETIGEGNI